MPTFSRVYSPQEFVAKLAHGEDKPPLTFAGMVKSAEDNDSLLFAVGTSCDNWLKVPLSAIESIESVAQVRCKDHSHPLVRLNLKQPTSDEASLFVSLATDTLRHAAQMVQRVLKQIPPDAGTNSPCGNCLTTCGTLPPELFWDCIAFCGPICPD